MGVFRVFINKDNLMPQEAHAIIRRILILTTLAIGQALPAAGDSHSHPCFSRTLSKHCVMKEYMDVFLFMDFFFFLVRLLSCVKTSINTTLRF